MFQTACFTESLATQSLVIFAIRTRRVPFVRSRPGRALAVATLATVALSLVLPISPLAGLFEFTPLPVGFLAILALMVVVYLALVELGKSVFFGGPPSLPAAPISGWRHSPALARIARRASRWSVRRT